MKCISEELIQKYIDGETNLKEEAIINSHLSECAECSTKVKEHRKTAKNIKSMISLLDKKEADIPVFEKPPVPKQTISPKIKVLVYSAIAACILILLLIIFQNSTDKHEVFYSFEIEGDYNANLPVSEQVMTIQIIDSKGNITDY